MFAYCGNNPVNCSDPYGYFTGDLIGNGGRGASSGNAGAGYGGGGIAIPYPVPLSIDDLDEYARSLVDTAAGRYADHQPRKHHVIPKGKFTHYGPAFVSMMDQMHDLLDSADISIDDPQNILIVSHGTHKSMHTKIYIMCIYAIMKQAKKGDEPSIRIALSFAWLYAASLDKFSLGF